MHSVTDNVKHCTGLLNSSVDNRILYIDCFFLFLFIAPFFPNFILYDLKSVFHVSHVALFIVIPHISSVNKFRLFPVIAEIVIVAKRVE